jgi:hypothetical protein
MFGGIEPQAVKHQPKPKGIHQEDTMIPIAYDEFFEVATELEAKRTNLQRVLECGMANIVQYNVSRAPQADTWELVEDWRRDLDQYRAVVAQIESLQSLGIGQGSGRVKSR